ncbi:hypothetical protein KXW04_002944 [Aspergillus fumigatus]|nr:hypothetical protein KXW04_002944 [Aspergillus fumigatus]KAH2807986.1 hypothetical protein KXW07_003855 [Aspergillus fumigatus]
MASPNPTDSAPRSSAAPRGRLDEGDLGLREVAVTAAMAAFSPKAERIWGNLREIPLAPIFVMYLYTLILLFLASANVNAYANPGACSGNCWTHDPGLYQRKSDGKYFRFATGGGIHIASADSLEGPWTDDGYVLPSGSIIDLDGKTNLWAPDLHYHDGTYYLYYAVSSLGSQNSAIGVATSKTMEAGSWTDHGTTGIESTPSSPYNTIDANWIAVGGTQYVNFGSYWNNLFQVEMENGLKVKSGATPHQIAYNASGIHRQEAAFMFERNNYFYLTFSGGIALGYNDTWPAPGEEYFIAVCRSTSATGGFVDKNGVSCLNSGGSLLLSSHDFVYGPGGQGILQDSSKGFVLYYHYADTRIGKAVEDYQFGWNQLKWENDWPSLSTSRVPNPALQLINLLLNYSHLRTQWSSSSTDRPGRRARPACASPLIEKGVDAEVVNVDLAKGEHLAESYLEMQPFGKVPVLQDTETGVQVFESRAIAQYIIAKYRGQGAELAPPESDLKAYALYQQAMSIEQSYFDPPIAQLAYEKVWKSMKGEGETDDERVKALLAQLDQTLQGYERVLSKQKYLAGDEVTFADLSHLPYGVFVEQFGFADLIAKYPRSKSTGRT